VQEVTIVLTDHNAEATCEDNEAVGVVNDMIRGQVKYVLGAWLSEGGSVSYQFECHTSGDTMDVHAEITLDGTESYTQALILQENLPNNGTANGVHVTLESVDIGSGGGLSGGAIAGIVIGSIVGFILAFVIVYIVITRNDRVESV